MSEKLQTVRPFQVISVAEFRRELADAKAKTEQPDPGIKPENEGDLEIKPDGVPKRLREVANTRRSVPKRILYI